MATIHVKETLSYALKKTINATDNSIQFYDAYDFRLFKWQAVVWVDMYSLISFRKSNRNWWQTFFHEGFSKKDFVSRWFELRRPSAHLNSDWFPQWAKSRANSKRQYYLPYRLPSSSASVFASSTGWQKYHNLHFVATWMQLPNDDFLEPIRRCTSKPVLSLNSWYKLNY